MTPTTSKDNKMASTNTKSADSQKKSKLFSDIGLIGVLFMIIGTFGLGITITHGVWGMNFPAYYSDEKGQILGVSQLGSSAVFLLGAWMVAYTGTEKYTGFLICWIGVQTGSVLGATWIVIFFDNFSKCTAVIFMLILVAHIDAVLGALEEKRKARNAADETNIDVENAAE